MKKIPLINYVKVCILFVVTIVVCLVLANNYNNKRLYEREEKHIQNFISNIKYEELQNYLTENHDGYIYIASVDDLSLEEFELSFKDFIVEEELEHEFVYLNSSSLNDDEYRKMKDYFDASLKNRNIDIPNCANIFVVRDGKIIDILFTSPTNITLESARNFVFKYQERI